MVASYSVGRAPIRLVRLSRKVDKAMGISEFVQGLARKVMEELGHGHREAIYQAALSIELSQQGIKHRVQYPIVVYYSGVPVGHCLADVVLFPTKEAPGWSEEEQEHLHCFVMELKVGQTVGKQSWQDQLDKYIRYIPAPPNMTVTGRVLVFS